MQSPANPRAEGPESAQPKVRAGAGLERPEGAQSPAEGRAAAAPAGVLVQLRGLKTYFQTGRSVVRAVDGVDLVIRRNRTLGVVGESGCGKSVMALSILGLIPQPPAKVTGEILYYREDGTAVDLAKLNPMGKAIRKIRGKEIAMVFQEPMTSLNPVYTIGTQIVEAIRLHQKVSAAEAKRRAVEMLRMVGIPAPEQRASEYPHQMSGGMRQRAMIAMALSCNPKLLICDEPTTALDVTIQAQILDLLRNIQEETRTAIVMISHDLGVIASIADEVAVMYLGQIVEYGSVRQVFKDRLHPYTQGLFHSIPRLGRKGKERLEPIRGMVPDPRNVPSGCRFADRCPHRMAVCDEPPPLFQAAPGHFSRCWLHGPGGEVR